jgi:uncharacterized protein YjbJ (UPF0337 family)
MEAMVDWIHVERNWKHLKGKIKEKWGNLTDDEIDKIEGRRDQLESKIQERYACTREIACRDIDYWLWLMTHH